MSTAISPWPLTLKAMADETQPRLDAARHNYTVGLRIGSHSIQADGYVVDFGDLKKAARDICRRLNHRTLLPAQSNVLRLQQGPDLVEVFCQQGVKMVLPLQEIACCFRWCTPRRRSWRSTSLRRSSAGSAGTCGSGAATGLRFKSQSARGKERSTWRLWPLTWFL
ncbi:unnamed protein product [Effrenium voratum]|nr:unnamed protein product [Effrenium voratum]